MAKQTFGLTKSTGYVQGEAIHYQMEGGKLAPAVDPLSQLNTQELEALTLPLTAEINARTKFVRTQEET